MVRKVANEKPKQSEQQEEMKAKQTEKKVEEKEVDQNKTKTQSKTEAEKKASKKVEKKLKKDPKLEAIKSLQEKNIRLIAEFDNYRKRSEKEKSQMFAMGAKDVLEKILPVIDNFERGLGIITEEEKEGAFAQGIEKIYKQLMTVLEEIGVRPIEAVGKQFDPNLHNAVMHTEDENLEENTITDEFQKGYLFRDTVIRHSMVKVVN